MWDRLSLGNSTGVVGERSRSGKEIIYIFLREIQFLFRCAKKKSEEAEWQLSFSFFSFPPRKEEKEKGLELYSLNVKERRWVEKIQKRINELFFQRRQKKRGNEKEIPDTFFPCINPLDTPEKWKRKGGEKVAGTNGQTRCDIGKKETFSGTGRKRKFRRHNPSFPIPNVAFFSGRNLR